jgi:hypothetical protein
MRMRPFTWILPAAMWLAVTPPLAAQDADPGAGTPTPQQGTESGENRMTRPFRGLFGLGDSERTGLDLSGQLYGAYDENVSATGQTQLFDPRYQQSGWYSGGDAQLSFNWHGERASANGWGMAAGNYYFDKDVPEQFVPTYSVGLGFTRPLGERNSLRASQTIMYSPYYLNGFAPGAPSLDDPSVPQPDFDSGLLVSGNTLTRYATSVTVTRRLSRLSSVHAGYNYAFSDYNDVNRLYKQQLMNVGFRRQLTRHATLHVGYGYRTVTNDVSFLTVTSFDRHMHDFDLGVDYSRAFALSMSRRTKLSFTTGSSFIASSDFSGSDVNRSSPSRFFVRGSAQLAHEMGRTWRAALVYQRSVGFSDLVLEPVTSNAVSATLSGLIGRRNELSFSATASKGEVGFDRQNNNYENYVAQALWRRALTRYIAAQVSYLYYDHDFQQSVLLPVTFPHDLRRNGVRFGLTAWLPLR